LRLLRETVEEASLAGRAESIRARAVNARSVTDDGSERRIVDMLASGALGTADGEGAPRAAEAGGQDAARRLVAELAELRTAVAAQTPVMKELSAGAAQSAASQAGLGGEGWAAAAKAGPSWLNSVFPLAGLIGGLVRWLGGKKEEPPELTPYAIPAPIEYRGAMLSSGALTTYDHYGDGVIRPMAIPAETARAGGQVPQAAPLNVVVQVNAMDSKSFSDHSAEIARAVKEAILQSHSLTDVLAEL
jgi:hypothetical protein